MGTWREELEAAREWKGYRKALRTLRKDGPTFDDLPKLSIDIAKRFPELRSYESKSTFSSLLDPQLPDTRPNWDKVELLLRICLTHQRYENSTEIVTHWADAYRRCGGDPGPRFPEPILTPKAEPTLPIVEMPPAMPPALVAEMTPVVVPVPEAATKPAEVTNPDVVSEVKWWQRRPVQLCAAVLLATGIVLAVVGMADFLGGGTSPDSSHDGKSPSTPHASTSASATASAPMPSATGVDAGTPTAQPSKPPPPSKPIVDPPNDSPSRYASRIDWSDNGGSTVVQVYADYTDTDRGRASATGHGYDIGQDLVVLCQVAGRTVPLGNYRGPAQRNGLWYRMSTGEYIPAIYVNTGRNSLPAC